MKKVLLIHGIFLGSTTMFPLSRRLQQLGYDIEIYDYPLFPQKQDLSEKFLERIEKFKPVAIVGHSLGGVVAVSQISGFNKSVKRVVCLGSPLSGSLIAKEVVRYSSSFLISLAAKELLMKGVSIPKTDIQVGVIAGTNGFLGFNMAFNVFKGEHDGTVAVEETKIPGTTEHMEIYVGHTGLIFSEKVIIHTDSFLKNGSFV